MISSIYNFTSSFSVGEFHSYKLLFFISYMIKHCTIMGLKHMYHKLQCRLRSGWVRLQWETGLTRLEKTDML